MNRISIKLKITLWYMVLMTGLVFLFLAVIFYISENIIYSTEYRHLQNIVESSFKDINLVDGELVIDNDFETRIDTIQLSVHNRNFEFLYGNSPLNFEFEDSFIEKKVKTVKNGKEKWYIYESKKNYPGYGDIWIRGVKAAVGADKAIETVVFISLTTFPFFLIFAGISGYIVTRNAFEPINKIRTAAEKINAGNDLSQRINLGAGKDEIYILANTFDKMFDKLQNSFENEVQFTSDVSHELRTPISVIMSQAEFGEEYVNNLPESKKIFRIILKEAQKMSQLVSELLTLARMDKGHQKLHLESVNLSELIEIVIEIQKKSADLRNIKINANISDEVYALIDEAMIMRVFINIISNAVTYGKENGNILIELFEKNEKVISKISDDGIGISKEHLNKIWSRFYQVDPSRNRSNNSGLGLYIVKWIVEAHKGKIYVESKLGKGSTFTIEIPKKI